ncbi:MAG TPA: HEAT repeat domain-containing protein [Chthoniobacteraceae bacterium]|nr:HEAT repeat domain-containing protein [Chthoniobacteraceae bacterium]
MKTPLSIALGLLVSGIPLAADSTPPPAVLRREALAAGGRGEAGLPVLEKAMQSKEALVRRAAVRSLAEIGPPAAERLRQCATDDPDPLVRRTALRAISRQQAPAQRLPVLEAGIRDADEMVRLDAVEALALLKEEPQAAALLQKASEDRSRAVSQAAIEALWPFHGEVVSARMRPEFQDLQLGVATRIDLPAKGWKFRVDPPMRGHLEGWHLPDFDDHDWGEGAIGRTWQSFGHQYEGVAWYRLSLDLPEEPKGVATDLVFEGVDQSAWVWINGEYLGAHDIGLRGYDLPFAIDCGRVLKWGRRNRIVVRVSKPSGTHGGIWKPVYFEVLTR